MRPSLPRVPVAKKPHIPINLLAKAGDMRRAARAPVKILRAFSIVAGLGVNSIKPELRASFKLCISPKKSDEELKGVHFMAASGAPKARNTSLAPLIARLPDLL